MNTKTIELLELAAKAANMPVEGFTICVAKGMRIVDDDHNFVEFWNPWEDDAQCLQLARQLSINIDYEDCCAWKRFPNGDLAQEYWGGDWWATDREAVVAVASEIGKLL